MRKEFFKRKTDDAGITIIALVITIVILIILVGITVGFVIDHDLINKSKQGAEKYINESEKEQGILGKAENIIDKIQLGKKDEEMDKDVHLSENKKVVEVGTNKAISEIIGNNKIDVIYNGNKIANTNQLPVGKYTFLHNEVLNQIEAIKEISEIPDLSGKNHTLYLKNGATVQRDADGEYYLNFDGEDDYGQIMELEESINFADGFEVEFEANWGSFNNYSRIMDFGNGKDNDNIVVANHKTTNGLYLFIFNGSSQADWKIGTSTLVLNERAKYRIKYEKISEGKYKATFYKNGTEIYSTETTYIVKNIKRTSNYIGISNWKDVGVEKMFNGKIYDLKITQADGTVVLHYDIDKTLNKKKANIEINNNNDWNAMLAKANEGATFFDRTIKLNSNINLTESEGPYIPRFEGTFDGNNKTINGLNITGTATSQGMIGINSGTIKNLNIENGYVESTYENTGMLAGTSYGAIEKVILSGEVHGANNTGGLVGLVERWPY